MNSHAVRIRQAGQVLLIVLFAGALCLPMASTFFGLAPVPSLQEKRRRAEAPEFKFKGPILAKFPASFEAYYNDNFAFRDQLVVWNNYVKVRGLKVSPRPNVLIGKEGWLYFQDGLLDHDHAIPPLTDQQLAAWVQVLEERQEWLAARGSRFVVVVAPDKHTIYPEFLPDWVKATGLSPRLDQLLTYARKHSNLTLVDLRPALLQAKEEDRLYHLRDTHWNLRGSFVGDRVLVEALSRWYPQLQPLSRSATSPTGPTFAGDLATMVGLPKILEEEYLVSTAAALQQQRWVSTPETTPGVMKWIAEVANPALPTAILFHDSFGSALFPFTSEHFRRIVYSLSGEVFDTVLVESEKPDMVIFEFVERRLAIDVVPSNPAAVVEAGQYKTRRHSLTGSPDIVVPE